MDNQWIETRPALSREDGRDSRVVGRVATKPVDRFGWKRHEPAVAQQPGGAGDRLWRRWRNGFAHRINLSAVMGPRKACMAIEISAEEFTRHYRFRLNLRGGVGDST